MLKCYYAGVKSPYKIKVVVVISKIPLVESWDYFLMLQVQRPGPHDQQDNYMSYSSLSRPPYEDARGSPLPPSGSPRGPGTPTRFNSYEPPYSSSHLYNDNSPRYSVDSNDSFHQRQPYDSYNHYDPR